MAREKGAKLSQLKQNQSMKVGSILVSRDKRSDQTITITKFDKTDAGTYVHFVKDNGDERIFGIEALLDTYSYNEKEQP